MDRMSERRPDTTDSSGDQPRPTPYEMVFAPAIFEEERFPAIAEEAAEREVDVTDPERFIMLGSVGDLLHRISPEEAPGSAVEQHGRLLFHAFHFWQAERRLYRLSEPLARQLVERTPAIGEWELTPPHPAGYLQFPRNLFWSRVEESATPEPVDGLFWTMIGEEDPAEPPYARIDALLVLGMRPDRPGFGVIPVGKVLEAGGRGHWAEADARPDGPDFGNILPGGELDALHALITPAEVLKFLSLLFWYVAEHPGAVGEPETAGPESPPDAEESAQGPPAAGRSRQVFRRIDSVDPDGNG